MLTCIHRLGGGRGVGGAAAVIACTLPLHLHLAVGPSGGCPGFPGRPGCLGRHSSGRPGGSGCFWGRGLRAPRLHDGERIEFVKRNLWALKGGRGSLNMKMENKLSLSV